MFIILMAIYLREFEQQFYFVFEYGLNEIVDKRERDYNTLSSYSKALNI